MHRNGVVATSKFMSENDPYLRNENIGLLCYALSQFALSKKSESPISKEACHHDGFILHKDIPQFFNENFRLKAKNC